MMYNTSAWKKEKQEKCMPNHCWFVSYKKINYCSILQTNETSKILKIVFVCEDLTPLKYKLLEYMQNPDVIGLHLYLATPVMPV